mmetsp:Transcript_84331/g.239023  ORF Transcript_84331/g.239023 Transcript_84331/m.239023 type:complete len:209 (+) Transcript_84331:413-1039(+)
MPRNIALVRTIFSVFSDLSSSWMTCATSHRLLSTSLSTSTLATAKPMPQPASGGKPSFARMSIQSCAPVMASVLSRGSSTRPNDKRMCAVMASLVVTQPSPGPPGGGVAAFLRRSNSSKVKVMRVRPVVLEKPAKKTKSMVRIMVIRMLCLNGLFTRRVPSSSWQMVWSSSMSSILRAVRKGSRPSAGAPARAWPLAAAAQSARKTQM